MNKFFPVKKELRIEKIEYNNEIYVRTKEVAVFLGVKQPFEFNSAIKNWSRTAILKGKDTEDFRNTTDEARTTFINIKDMIKFLEQGLIPHKMEQSSKEKVLVAFKNALGW